MKGMFPSVVSKKSKLDKRKITILNQSKVEMISNELKPSWLQEKKVALHSNKNKTLLFFDLMCQKQKQSVILRIKPIKNKSAIAIQFRKVEMEEKFELLGKNGNFRIKNNS